MRKFNWTRANEVAGPGTFILTAIILLIMVWPMIKPIDRVSITPNPSKDSQRVEAPRKTPDVPWIMPSMLAFALIVAGFLHYKAAQVTRLVPDIRAPKTTNPPPQPPQSVALVSAVTSAPIVVPAQPGRVIANASVESLCEIYNTHTTAQADRLADVYIGTWIGVFGRVNDARPLNDEIMMVSVHLRENHIGPMAFCHFDKPWHKRVSLIKRDDEITIVGEISRFGSQDISLTNCEMI